MQKNPPLTPYQAEAILKCFPPCHGETITDKQASDKRPPKKDTWDTNNKICFNENNSA